MLSVLRVGGLAAILLLLSACERIEDWFYEGTQIGLAKCLAKVSTPFVGDKLALQYCLNKHEREFPISVVTGRAGYRKAFGEIYFSGDLMTKNSDVIVTSFSVSVTPKGKELSATKGFSHVRIKYGEPYEFLFTANDMKISPPDSENSEFTWTLLAVRGIKIVGH